jgi:hypothetical protein
MNRRERRTRLTGSWRALHGAVWLIGLAILFLTGWLWPGILMLVALSLVIEALLRQFAPHAFEEESPAGAPPPAPSVPEHRLDLLPSNCPKCGGPIRGHEVKWTGPQSADCPYCGANLPMAKA